MTYQEKAQQLFQKHYSIEMLKLLIVIGEQKAEMYTEQLAISYAHRTAQECKQAAIKAAGVNSVQFAVWWDNVIAELEKMKPNQ